MLYLSSTNYQHVSGTVLSALHILTHLVLQQLDEVGIIIITFILQMRKPWQRQVKKLAQGHTVRKWCSQDSNLAVWF